MPLVQDQSFDLLASSPACYNCTTDAPVSISSIQKYKATKTIRKPSGKEAATYSTISRAVTCNLPRYAEIFPITMDLGLET